MRFDTTGKISFDHIYTLPDPRAFFRTLRVVDYRIPSLAKPYFARLIQEYAAARGVSRPTVLDVGCSYGVNAALHRCAITMDELYQHYGESGVAALSHDALVARDRELVRSRRRPDGARFVGFDSSRPALDYALSAGFVDAVVHADLEADRATELQRAQFAELDLVVSTGCLGYVTERTISQIAAAARQERPWMAHFVLRMFSYEPIAANLAELGYETVSIDGVFRQRRFASFEEQSQVLDTLAGAGVDPRGLEAEGWFYARLYLSRPRDANPGALAELATAMNAVSS